MRALAWGVVFILAAGCSRHEISSRTRRETATPVPRVSGATRPAGTPDGLKTMLTDSDGSEPGRVHRVQNGFLELQPYAPSQPRIRLRLLPTAPILRGRVAVSSDALAPGTDVRVCFKNPKGPEPPEAVGVELLAPNGKQ